MAETLELEVTRQSNVGLLAVKGYINNLGGEKIAAACEELVKAQVVRFVIDLAECRIVNSVGISILIELVEKVHAQNGQLAFCAANPTIAKTLRIMGLLQSCPLHPSRDEAVKAVAG